jgi:hypothetical protein
MSNNIFSACLLAFFFFTLLSESQFPFLLNSSVLCLGYVLVGPNFFLKKVYSVCLNAGVLRIVVLTESVCQTGGLLGFLYY